MILELDCGNSFIKWRVLDDGRVVSGGIVDADAALIDAVSGCQNAVITRCRLVSVRTDDETSGLVRAIEAAFRVQVVCAKPSKSVGGVSNGYEAFDRLGLDRWLALVGGFELAKGACLILDFGTAVTADFVNSDGRHLGGFICPGLPLMRDQLRTHTRRIRYDSLSAEQALFELTPGRTTVQAVERGCLLMMRGFVLTQIELAREYWGQDYTIYLTGGDANLVRPVVPDARLVQDLVFVGLALACPFV